MAYNFVILILLLEVKFKIVLIWMDLISKLSLFNYIPNKLKIIHKKHKLPNHPNNNRYQSNTKKGYHRSTIHKFLFSCQINSVKVHQKNYLKTNV